MGRHREFDLEEALDAAMKVFWQKGYEGASYADLSQAMGVARPGIYAAFGNKRALFLKSLDHYDSRYTAFLRDALDEPEAVRVVERILRESAEVQTMAEEHPGCLGINGALAGSQDVEIVRTELVRRRKASEASLRRRLERARDEGDLPTSANVGSLARFVMAVTQGMAVQAKAGATREDLLEVASQALAGWPLPPKRNR